MTIDAHTHDFTKLAFPLLDVNGSNFPTWSQHVTLYLTSQSLSKHLTTVIPTFGQSATDSEIQSTIFPQDLEDASCTMFILLQHMTPELQTHFITAHSPHTIWQSLQSRFGDYARILGPSACVDWSTLRFSDFTDVKSYVSRILNISERMHLSQLGDFVTDANKIEKTLSTFPIGATILAQEFYDMGIISFNDLITVLYISESQNILFGSQSAPGN